MSIKWTARVIKTLTDYFSKMPTEASVMETVQIQITEKSVRLLNNETLLGLVKKNTSHSKRGKAVSKTHSENKVQTRIVLREPD